MELSVSQISGFLVKTKAAEDCGVVFGVEKSSEQFSELKADNTPEQPYKGVSHKILNLRTM